MLRCRGRVVRCFVDSPRVPGESLEVICVNVPEAWKEFRHGREASIDHEIDRHARPFFFKAPK